MITFINSLDQYFTMSPIILAGLCGSACGLIGPFFVWRKVSLLGDALAHSAMTPVSLAFLLGLPPLLVILPFNILFALLLAFISMRSIGSLDSMIAVFFAGFMGLGLLISFYTGVANEEILHIIFGNIEAVNGLDGLLTLILVCAIFGHIFYWRKDLLLLVLQRDLARVEGVRVGWHETWLVILMSLTVTVTLKIMGTVLLTSLLITPPVILRMLSRSMFKQLIGSSILGGGIAIIGIAMAHVTKAPASAVVATLSLCAFSIALAAQKLKWI